MSEPINLNKDIFTSARVLNFGLKTINLQFSQYDRSDGLNALIVTLGTTFVGNWYLGFKK